MSQATTFIIERERQTLLQQLDTAEAALRTNLHTHGVDEPGRTHIERALSHVREAYIAINEVGRARSVQQLVSELVKVERLFEKVRQQAAPGVVTKPITI